MSVQSALYLLERAGHIERSGGPSNRTPGVPRPSRSIMMVDSVPMTQLRINPGDVSRRSNLERRKLREMIEFCYTEYSYRANILYYFAHPHHATQCGMCGN